MPTSDPSLSQVIANFKSAASLALAWTQGDANTIVASPGGNYPSLAKLTKDTQDALAAFYVNPAFTGKAGFTPPRGTVAEREANPPEGRVRYNTDLDTLEMFGPKGWLPIPTRLLATYSGSVGVVTGTTRIPYDATPPLSTEGTQLWSKTVTPTVVGSEMHINFACMVDNTNQSRPVTVAVFRGNTLIGFASTGVSSKSNNMPGNLSLVISDTTTSLTPVTYSCRVGNDSSGTWYVGRGQTQSMGDANRASWTIDEVMP